MKNLSIFFADSKPFNQLVGLCLLVLIGFILLVALQLVVTIPQPTDAASIRLNLLWQGLSQLVLFLLPTLTFAWLFHGSPARYLHIDLHGRKWFLGFVAIVILLVLIPIVDWVTYWNEQWQLGSMEETMRQLSQRSETLTQQLLSLTTPGDLLLQLVVVALAPAVCEEVFFRGGLQQVLQRWFGNIPVAIVVTALVFSLSHGDLYGFVPRFILGLLLGYFYVASGSIVVNICAHFFNNAIVVVLYYLYHRQLIFIDPSEPLFFSWTTTIISGLSGLMLYLVYFTKILQKEHPKK